MKKWIVYRHTSPSGKVYVGITSQKSHIRWGVNGCKYLVKSKYNDYIHPYFANAILKYGWDNIKHEIILEGISKEHAIYTEKYLISWYKLHNISYNITEGGEGVIRKSFSDITKQRMSQSAIGRVVSQSTKDKLSKLRKGKRFTDSWKKNISSALKGKSSLPVLQYSKDGMFLKEYASITEAGDINNICKINISRCCRGIRKTAGNYKWTYKNNKI